MGHELIGDSDLEERRNLVLLAYVEALRGGREPDRTQFLEDHRPPARPEAFSTVTTRWHVTTPPPWRGTSVGQSSRHAMARRTPGIGELGDFRLLRDRLVDGVVYGRANLAPAKVG